MKTDVDVIIIGAGAAGLFVRGIEAASARAACCPAFGSRQGWPVKRSGFPAVADAISQIWKSQPDRFLSKNPRFAISALKRFTQWDFIDAS